MKPTDLGERLTSLLFPVLRSSGTMDVESLRKALGHWSYRAEGPPAWVRK